MSTNSTSSSSSYKLENENVNNNNINNKMKTSHDIDVYVTNVVCSYSTKCSLNLRRIAMEGLNVEYKKDNNMITMKLRKPCTTASMWSSGKVTCIGATSEPDAYKAARRICRLLQKMKFKVRLTNYRVVNVLATCCMPFTIDLGKLAENFRRECSYEPELHPGATFKLNDLRATLKLFSSGSVTLTAPSVSQATKAIDFIYPVLLKYTHNNSAASLLLSNNTTNNNINQSSLINSSQPTVVVEPPVKKPDIVPMPAPPQPSLATINYSYKADKILYTNCGSTSAAAAVATQPPPQQSNPIHDIHHVNHHLNHHTTTAPNSYDSIFNPFSFSNTTGSTLANSQSHHHTWFNEAPYLIDNVLEDFLP